MLGFDGALQAPKSARFGQGSGRILLIGVSCHGTENNLTDCARLKDDVHNNCRHAEDAGAVCYSGAHPNPFEVRLIGGANEAEGRVEVMHDGSWGTVCGINWDLRDARVVCRMLGFDGAVEAPSSRFGQGPGPIFLIFVSCDGTEENLADSHPNPFQVRLVGGFKDSEGRVEVIYDGSWGTICGEQWDLKDARVVCRMLGFDGAFEAPTSARFGQGSGRNRLIGVSCDGTEDNLADCAHIRFKDSEGRVEVIYDGSWGTICGEQWDLKDARVVCRMLGFDGAFEAPTCARFGQGSGRNRVIGVSCDGTEDNLAACAHIRIYEYY
eukprot:XP_780854.3 PREDICTED: deleted in malignant brain tumors 1 protein-like [Strongylocentrotus purpuratus]